MAEFAAVVGLAAAIVTLIDASTKVYERVKELKKGTALDHVIKRVGLLRETLKRLQTAEAEGLFHSASGPAISRVVEACLTLITALDGVLSRMLPADASSKYQRVFKGIQSFGRDRRIKDILAELEGSSAQLTSFFAVDASIISRETARMYSKTNTTPVQCVSNATFFEVPALQVSYFVGRDDLLNKIDISFNGSAETLHVPVSVLLGMGGQGKTQIALAYCNRSRAAYRGIFWIDASSKSTTSRSFETIAMKLGVPEAAISPDPKTDFVKSVLSGWTESWLLVFDNYDDPTSFKDIKTYFPIGCGRILCTSRHADVGRLGTTLNVGSLSELEGLDLLLHRSHHEGTTHNVEAGTAIVQKLGCLALAIDQAAAYITFRHLPLTDFMDHYERRKKVILNHVPDSVWEYRRSLGDAEDQTSLSTFTTWEMSFQQIAQDDNERRNIGHFLTLAAFLNPAKISEDLFEMYFKSTWPKPEWMLEFCSSGAWDQDIYQDTVCGLFNLSLIQGMEATSTPTSFSLHPLIRGWLQLRREPDEQRRFSTEVLGLFAAFVNMHDCDWYSYRICVELSSHIEFWLDIDDNIPQLQSTESLEGWRGVKPIIPHSIFTLLDFFLSRPEGKDELSERLASRNLNGCIKHLGRNHSFTGDALTRLGTVYQAQGRVETANSMYRSAFDMALQTKGGYSLSAELLDGLAGIAHLQGHHETSATIHLTTFQKSLFSLGDCSLSTIWFAIKAGKSYQKGQDFVTAAIFIEAAVLVLNGLSNQHMKHVEHCGYLGDYYMSRNNIIESEKWFRLCLGSNLLKEAGDYLEQAREVKAIIYGPFHEQTARASERLGFFYRGTERLELAVGCFEQALEGFKRSLGSSHFYTRISARILSTLQGDMKCPEDAEARGRTFFAMAAFNMDDVSLFTVDQPGWDPLQHEYTPTQIEVLEWADRALRSQASIQNAAGAGSEKTEPGITAAMGQLEISNTANSPQKTQGLDTAETSDGQPPQGSSSSTAYLSMAHRLLPPVPNSPHKAQKPKHVDEDTAQDEDHRPDVAVPVAKDEKKEVDDEERDLAMWAEVAEKVKDEANEKRGRKGRGE